MAAVVMRTNILLLALDQDVLAKWRDATPDPVFAIVATYPITCREDKSFDFDMGSFITVLEGSS